MAIQIEITWPETGNQVGRTFTASGVVWDDSETVLTKTSKVDVECTLSNSSNNYTNQQSITLPAGGSMVAWNVSLPSSGQAAIGTYTLTAVLRTATNPPSDQEIDIQVVNGGPAHAKVQFDTIEE